MKKIILLLAGLALFAVKNQAQNQPYQEAKEAKDYIAPYLHSFFTQAHINSDSLVKLLLGDSIKSGRDTSFMPFDISSEKHIVDGWKYFTAKTPLIYEMTKVEQNRFVVLYNKFHPEYILESKKSQWRIAVVDSTLRLIDDKSFITPWKYNNPTVSMWDMIYTDMEVGEPNIIAKITYVHTGSGGGRDQEFTCKISFAKDKINAVNVTQTRDDMK